MEGRISPLYLKQVFLDIFLIFDKKGFVEGGETSITCSLQI